MYTINVIGYEAFEQGRTAKVITSDIPITIFIFNYLNVLRFLLENFYQL